MKRELVQIVWFKRDLRVFDNIVENEYGFEISEEMQFEDQVRTINGMADLIRKEAK